MVSQVELIDDDACPPEQPPRPLSAAVTNDVAPLDAGDLVIAAKPFGESRMLSRHAYRSEEVFAWEQYHLFERGWVCLGRATSLGVAGDQLAERAGESGVLLVRGKDGILRAFANACRHRGHELAPCGAEATSRPLVVCPYHLWSYRLDGSLNRSPGYEQLPGFDAAEHGLAEVPMVEWQGYVFVNVSGEAPPLEEHLAGLAPIVAPYEPERLVVAARHDYQVAANWKVLHENYQECYHCPAIHPELCRVSPPTSSWNFEPTGGAWIGGRMLLSEGAVTMSFDGGSPAAPLRGLGTEERGTVAYVGVVPNLLLSLHPDYVMMHLLTPLGPGLTRIVCEWAFAPEETAHEGFDPAYAVDFWDLTNRQDWAACESVQRGLASPAARPGLLSPAEDAVYQFETMIAHAYAGSALDGARSAGVKRGGER